MSDLVALDRRPEFLGRLEQVARGSPRLVRWALVAAVMAVIVTVLLAVNTPPHRELFPAASEVDRAEIVEVLRASGVSVSVDPASGALTVATQDYFNARMLAAAAGLPRGAPAGYDMLTDLPLGAPRSVERARLRQAQELELAQSIGSIADVAFARVHLGELQGADDRASGASVMVSLRAGRKLSDGQVAAIRHLVAFSRAGLAVERVSVVDQSGALLGVAFNGPDERQQRLEAGYREHLRTLLAPVLGEGNFSAVVTVALSNTVRDSTRERFDPAGSVVRSEQRDSSATGGQQPRGIPGTVSNSPPPPPTVSATPAAEAQAAPQAAGSERLVRNYELARDVEVVREAAPGIARITVSVAIREGKAPTNLPQLEKLIGDAVGLDPGRGDRISVSVQPFAAPDTVPEAPWWQDVRVLPAAQTALLGLVALVAAGVISRGLGGLVKGRSALPETMQTGQVLLPRDSLRAAIERDPEQAKRAVRAMLEQPVR